MHRKLMLASILSFLLLLTVCTEDEEIYFPLEGTTWSNKNAEWLSPVGAGDEESAMNLIPMYFGPDGFFKRMGWITYRDHGSNVIAFGGEGGVNVAGAWVTQNDSLYIAQQIVYRAIRKIGETIPTPIEVECISIKELSHSPPSITIDGRTFVPEDRLDERGTKYMTAQWWPDSISVNLKQYLVEYLR